MDKDMDKDMDKGKDKSKEKDKDKGSDNEATFDFLPGLSCFGGLSPLRFMLT
jgi:hypothetical protein